MNFKVLSIDGGGIKGLYSARVLQKIEEHYQIKVADYFDLICGTSTGGLIALALALGKDATEIANFYRFRGPEIFPNATRIQRFIGTCRQQFWKGKYSDCLIKKAIEDFIGGQVQMRDLKNLVCIPSFNLTTGQPIVFKNPHLEGGLSRDGKLKVLDVALATSAAPTYFPISELQYPSVLEGQFIDGGVWANNPALCGFIEAISYFVGRDKEFSSVSIMSIASVTTPTGWQIGTQRRRSFLGWRAKMFDPFMDGQSYFTDFALQQLFRNELLKGEYLRIPSPPNLSERHMKLIGLDVATNEAIRFLDGLGSQQGIDFTTKPDLKSKLDPFFTCAKSYSFNSKLATI